MFYKFAASRPRASLIRLPAPRARRGASSSFSPLGPCTAIAIRSSFLDPFLFFFFILRALLVFEETGALRKSLGRNEVMLILNHSGSARFSTFNELCGLVSWADERPREVQRERERERDSHARLRCFMQGLLGRLVCST